MDTPVPGLRVYLCAAGCELQVHIEKVRETLLHLDMLPVTSETFTVLPGSPAADSQANLDGLTMDAGEGSRSVLPVAHHCDWAAQADVVVVLVGHRLGELLPGSPDGDGKRPRPWLEVEAARAAGKPVFAFLVEPPDQSGENCLQEFRAYLDANSTIATLRKLEDLAARVAHTVSVFARSAVVPEERTWRPLVCHALQPAAHFQGRQALRDELVRWICWPNPADRVISLVAAGGTGKTALAERVLADLDGRVPAGLLVWSFYEDPRTEEFLRVACAYFGGSSDVPVGGRLVRLQQALAGEEAHVLVLDGLERVQALGNDGRPRGTVEDPQLKRLLRYLAGGPGRSRALVTSRFPLVDLDSWVGHGHWSVQLDDLEGLEARAVLRAWGVHGSDYALDALVERLHGHALSLAVLGSYLGHFCGGDPARAPAFDPDERSDDDPRAARLGRLLGEYAQALSEVERDLLARLAAFPGGVKVSVLSILVNAGGSVAGSLQGCQEARLVGLLERLRKLGLVFASGSSGEKTYTAHPFLRDYFHELLGVPAAAVHEVVRARLAPDLQARPDSKPRDKALLDRYEALIEHTRLAGRLREAFDLYRDGLGFYDHLGKVLGENARGLRIVAAFSTDGSMEKLAPDLADGRTLLASDWGLYSKNLGDLVTARRAFEFELSLLRRRNDHRDCSIALQNLCDLALLAGSLPEAQTAAARALEEALNADYRSGPNFQN
jgi:hypothetical protein